MTTTTKTSSSNATTASKTKKSVPYIPDGLTPSVVQLVIADARKAVAFYERALGAQLLHAMPHEDGTIMHGLLQIGAAKIFISEANKFGGPTAANTFLYLENVDEVFAKAVAAGATVLAPLTNMFWGDRWGMIQDPSGNIWQLAKHVEDVPPEEMAERAQRAKQ